MERKFYDIHFHTLNMNHPSFSAFVQHFTFNFLKGTNKYIKKHRLKTFFLANYVLLRFLFFKPFNYRNITEILEMTGLKESPHNFLNLLVTMENDIGNIFLLLENCFLEHIFKEGKLAVGGETYDKVVLTPLTIDFGLEHSHFQGLHYAHGHSIKTILEQAGDVLNGITEYKKHSHHKIFEIYPFLGINTKNYTYEELENLLKKFFGSYKGTARSFHSNMESFDGHLDSEKSLFAGIKLYPLMGFDPWPTDPEERMKVELLYQTCEEKQIPITCHSSDEGFQAVSNTGLMKMTSPEKWVSALEKYTKLKLNLAHFGKQEASTEWQNIILKLIQKYEHVYTDISYRGFNDTYYKTLKDLIHIQPPALKQKVLERVLFGSDFMVNLLKTESYCTYFHVFSNTQHLSSHEKNLFCSTNPERFLFL
ncbi:MAG: amidohydrolase [Clostridia bacterium]|nr:amidohydrolase [Clostridia bacterium]